MIIKRFTGLFAIVASMAVASSISAAEFQPNVVPDDARWYLHINFDELRGTQAVDELDDVQNEIQEAGIPLMPYHWLQERYGIEQGDMHSLTLYGKRIGPKDRVAILNADFTKEKVVDVVKSQQELRTSKHGDHTLYTWTTRDRGEKVNKPHPDVTLAIRDNLAIMTPSEELTRAALDVLDGTLPSLQEKNALLADEVADNVLVRGAFLQIEKADDRPLLNQVLMMMQRTTVTIGRDDDQLIIHLSMQADDAEKAKDAQKLLIGLHAAAQIAAVENSGNSDTDVVEENASKHRSQREGLVSRLPRTFDMTSQRKGNELILTLKSDLSELQTELAEYFEQRKSKRVEQTVAKPITETKPYPGKDVPATTPTRPEEK